MAEKTQDMHLPSLQVHGEVFEDYRNEAIEFNYICVSLLSAKRQRKDNGIYFPIMLAGSAAPCPRLCRRGASAKAKEKPTYNDPDPELFLQVASVSEKSDSKHCFGAITSHLKVSIKFSVIDYP